MTEWIESLPFWAQFPALVMEVLVLFYGGNLLVNGAVGIALRLRMSRLAVGATVVALGTSLPELLVSMMAALGEHDGVAIGNIFGSNVANVGLVLGAGALLSPVVVRSSATKGLLLMYIASTLCLGAAVWFLPGETISAPLGLVMLAALVAVMLWLLRRPEADTTRDDDEQQRALWISSGLVLLGAAMLYASAETFVASAVVIASRLGASDLVIGVTVVALGTSLPELAATVMAGVKGEGDVGVGNVVGSNLFNLLLVLGAVAVVRPLPMPLRSDPTTLAYFGVMILFGLLLLPVVLRGRAGRWYGAFLVGMYGLAIAGYLLV